MQAIEPYQALVFHGNMDPECEKWLIATIVLPRPQSVLLRKSMEQDYGLEVTLCEGRKAAEDFVKSHPSWA